MSKTKTARRGFTLADRRALNLEKRTLPLTIVVAVMAATISFVALRWVGIESGMSPWIAPLLPLTIDGLGIICSLGIIRSHAAGDPPETRRSEWVGLGLSLVLSMLGNAYHSLGEVPAWLKVVNAIAVPGVVAYSIHVLGRYLETGVSHKVMEDSPDQIVSDVWQTGSPTRKPSTRTAQAATPRIPAPAAAQPAQEPRAAAPAPPRTEPSGNDARERVQETARELLAQGTNPVAKTLYIDMGLDSQVSEATVRRWVQQVRAEWETEQEARTASSLDERVIPLDRRA